MKLCIYGNSHVSAFKSAHENIAQKYPNVEIEYWALTQNKLNFCEMSNEGVFAVSNAMRAQNRRRWRRVNMQAVTINGKRDLDLRNFDVILRVGLDDGRERLRALLAGFSVEDMNAPGPQISRDFFESISRSEIAKMVALNEWQYPTNAKRFVMTIPYPSEAMLSNSSKNFDYVRTFAETSQHHAVLQQHEDYVAQAFDALGVTYFPQAPDTFSDHLLSKELYSSDARKITNLDEKTVRHDYLHLNDKYGEICLERLLGQLL
jgi:hypothetical protein